MIPAPYVTLTNSRGQPVIAVRLKPVKIRIPGGMWLERARNHREPRSRIIRL